MPSTALLLAATVVAGFGFGSGSGTAFFGAFRLLAHTAAREKRAQPFSAVYVACYLANSVPAIVAGLVIPRAGPRDTAIGAPVGEQPPWPVTGTADQAADAGDRVQQGYELGDVVPVALLAPEPAVASLGGAVGVVVEAIRTVRGDTHHLGQAVGRSSGRADPGGCCSGEPLMLAGSVAIAPARVRCLASPGRPRAYQRPSGLPNAGEGGLLGGAGRVGEVDGQDQGR
ncbi:hypothetical protein [Streptomyces flaveolus]|uniref:hypothetical protein n=1 Tax=Streptomyces flaveolus TaxID=67297 RepID=UPI003F4DA29D